MYPHLRAAGVDNSVFLQFLAFDSLGPAAYVGNVSVHSLMIHQKPRIWDLVKTGKKKSLSFALNPWTLRTGFAASNEYYDLDGAGQGGSWGWEEGRGRSEDGGASAILPRCPEHISPPGAYRQPGTKYVARISCHMGIL